MASLVRVSTGQQIKPIAPSLTPQVQYPCSWFDANPGSKPILSIELTTKDIGNVRGVVKAGICNNDIKINSAVTFLYLFAKKVTDQLPDKWESYGRVIGQVGEKVSVLDLLDIRETIKVSEGTTTVTDSQDDTWIAAYLLGIYRMIRATVGEYKTSISQRITTQMKALRADAQEMTDVVDLYRGWEHHRSYNTLVAAFDMFFYKFPKHDLANLRIATTVSRNKDCAALMSYGYINNVLGLAKLTDLMDWVFIGQIGDNIDHNEFSYFPYQVDMGLVTKSAFSAVANPHFFEWVHMIGALLRQSRSMNARQICDSQAMNMLLNAACVAYVHSHTFTVSKVYTIDGKDTDFNRDEEIVSDAEDTAMKSKDPSDWVTLFQSTDNQMPTKIRKFLHHIARGIREPREGTVDAYLATVIAALD